MVCVTSPDLPQARGVSTARLPHWRQRGSDQLPRSLSHRINEHDSALISFNRPLLICFGQRNNPKESYYPPKRCFHEQNFSFHGPPAVDEASSQAFIDHFMAKINFSSCEGISNGRTWFATPASATAIKQRRYTANKQETNAEEHLYCNIFILHLL